MSKRKDYPLISGSRRRPDPKKDGKKNYGKPCIFCGAGTCGEKWVQFSYMRGDDEVIRVCNEHWKIPDNETILQMYEYNG